MNDFLFLYRGGQRPTGTPEQMQNSMQKWMTWMKELGDKGHIKDMGHPLEQTGKVVKAHKTVTDGPFADATMNLCLRIAQLIRPVRAVHGSRAQCPAFREWMSCRCGFSVVVCRQS